MSRFTIADALHNRQTPLTGNTYGFDIEVYNQIDYLHKTLKVAILIRLYRKRYAEYYEVYDTIESSEYREELNYRCSKLMDSISDLEYCLYKQDEDWSMYEYI